MACVILRVFKTSRAPINQSNCTRGRVIPHAQSQSPRHVDFDMSFTFVYLFMYLFFSFQGARDVSKNPMSN